MKTLVQGMVSFVIVVITVTTVINICNNHSRSVNLQDNLQEAIESSLETAMTEHNYDISNSDELIADMMEGIALYLDDNSTFDVTVNKADTSTGILSVHVTEHYKNLNGNVQDISCDKTVILDHYDPLTINKYTVTYVIDAVGSQVPYKTYQLMDGDAMRIPVAPSYDGMTFKGWKLDGTDTIMSNGDILALPITQGYTFHAVFE